MSRPFYEQVVRDARAIIADRRRRARFVDAVDAAGVECDACHPGAIRFCAGGALVRAAFELTGEHEKSHELGWRLAGMIERAAGVGNEDDDGFGLAKLSDDRGQKAVLKAIDAFLAVPGA